MLKISVNEWQRPLGDPTDLEPLLNADNTEHHREIWVQRDAGKMCALVAGDVAWLMMLRFDGDAGFSSRNPNYRGLDDAMLTFKLTNGQIDEYPAAWTLPTATWIAALLYFAETGQLHPDIKWHDDGCPAQSRA